MPDSLDTLHEHVFERAEGMTDAQLVAMLLRLNLHGRLLAREIADEFYGGADEGLPNTLQAEAATLTAALLRFVPQETHADGWAIFAEDDSENYDEAEGDDA